LPRLRPAGCRWKKKTKTGNIDKTLVDMAEKRQLAEQTGARCPLAVDVKDIQMLLSIFHQCFSIRSGV
jgi:hypothetical protein